VQDGFPTCYWISAFYFPQGFLTSALQNYSRKQMIPVDILGFEFNVLDTDNPIEFEEEQAEKKSESEDAIEGIVVYGMFFDGCKWDYEAPSL